MGGKPKSPKYDVVLAERVRVALGPRRDVEERRMFGGLCFLVRGHMTVGVEQRSLMVRVGRDGHADALGRPHAREMDFTGKPLRTMVYVDPGGTGTDAALREWVATGVAFTETLPAK